jgi:very-short-patch-repair endonuclease
MGNNQGKFKKETRFHLIEQAREFRKHPTEAETFLWRRFRSRQLGGNKFKRQRVFGPFILDFYCPGCKLAVELYGGIHRQQRAYDAARTKQLQSYGVAVMRFENEAVINEIERVLEDILQMCSQISNK